MGKPQVAIVHMYSEGPAPPGALCEAPEKEAFRKAIKLAVKTGDGVDPKKLPKCGKPAKVATTTQYENAPEVEMNYCADCRPRDYDEGREIN